MKTATPDQGYSLSVKMARTVNMMTQSDTEVRERLRLEVMDIVDDAALLSETLGFSQEKMTALLRDSDTFAPETGVEGGR